MVSPGYPFGGRRSESNYSMNRDQIIAKTLDDMQRYETDFENREQESADRDAEYNRDIVIPEMRKRLPGGDITTCGELQIETECCPTCHGLYPHCEMHVLNLPDGRTGWICCAVRGELIPESAIKYDSPEALKLMSMLGGDESGGQGA
jgi:hypothetical protein